jgi:hypothetical protein
VVWCLFGRGELGRRAHHEAVRVAKEDLGRAENALLQARWTPMLTDFVIHAGLPRPPRLYLLHLRHGHQPPRSRRR